jgi:hypothetical protein
VFRAAPLLVILTLAACGGSDDQNLTEKHSLQLQAEAWENRMPAALLPGQTPSCTPLIVWFSIRAGEAGSPVDLRALSVSLTKQGVVAWDQPVSSSETGWTTRWTTAEDWLSLVGSSDGNPPPGTRVEQVFSGVARGCTTQVFAEDDDLLVKVAIESKGESAWVESALKLQAAY